MVVGTRSAVFSPLERLGLMIVDEEQEHTYHSENSPRYDAREVARRRAAAHGALLVLASATPSIESFYAARAGRMQLVQLLHRYNDMPLPKVYLADMRAWPSCWMICATRWRMRRATALRRRRWA